MSRPAPEHTAAGGAGATGIASPRTPDRRGGADVAALAPAAIVTLESGGVTVYAVVHRADGRLLRVELLASGLPAALAAGNALTVDARVGSGAIRCRATVAAAGAFPLVELAIEDVVARAAEPPGPQIALAFPARYEVIPAQPGTIAARVRARLDGRDDAGRGAGEPAEVALLALAKMMTRLDARFDRVLGRGAAVRRREPAAATGTDEPHEVLVFSLAKMMLTRLDEKFDRLLAAMRDPAVLSRPPTEIEDGGGIGAPPHQVLVLHALTRLMESLSEKFERVVAVIDGHGEPSRLDDAWALAIGEAGVMLGMATPVTAGAVVDLELRLPFFPALPLLVFGRVDAVTDHGADLPERRYQAAVTFVALPEADRELIVQLMMRKQREQLRARHDHAGSA